MRRDKAGDGKKHVTDGKRGSMNGKRDKNKGRRAAADRKGMKTRESVRHDRGSGSHKKFSDK